MSLYYVIGIEADPVENRCEKYFTGHCTPGFEGVTTPFLKDAYRYKYYMSARHDREKLVPARLGQWVIMEKDDETA